MQHPLVDTLSSSACNSAICRPAADGAVPSSSAPMQHVLAFFRGPSIVDLSTLRAQRPGRSRGVQDSRKPGQFPVCSGWRKKSIADGGFVSHEEMLSCSSSMYDNSATARPLMTFEYCISVSWTRSIDLWRYARCPGSRRGRAAAVLFPTKKC